MAVAHEAVDLRVWDQNYSQWQTLAPWATLQLDHRADLSIDTLTLTLSDKHPAMGRLRGHRNTPVPITLAVNGVEWSGLVTALKQASGGVVTVTASSDDKHLHRMLARSRVATAVDSEMADITGQVGTILADLTASAAQRTGLPVYINVQHKGDVVRLPVKSEDTVASVVDSALKASDTFATVRMLLPGMKIPTGGVKRVQGVAEGTWEADGIARGLWPEVNDATVSRVAVHPPVAPTPHLSWFGSGSIAYRGAVVEPTPGICWVPFITSDVDRGYWQDGDTNVRSATKEQMWGARRNGWHEHVTEWAAGTFKPGRGDVKLLEKCAGGGLLTKPSGKKIATAQAAYAYIGSSAAYAWWTGTGWVLANTADFKVEDARRQPAQSNRLTPGVLVQTRGVRDRRHIVFSSTPGGGLESWETDTTSPEAAMIHASAQLDETVLKAIQAGSLTASSQIERLDAGQMKQVIGAANNVPEVVEALDVSAQPFATISGTDLAYSRVGAKVNIGAAGPFFYREMTLSLGNSGTNPVGDMGREWAKAQGSTSLTLTPGFGTANVFGDDVRINGRVVPGWRPGDRVSFVDGTTRMSEVVVGYSLTKNWDGPLNVTPVLGRADNGVMDGLMNRLRSAEDGVQRALTQAPRRAPVDEVYEKVAESPAVTEINGRIDKLATSETLNSEIVQLNEQIKALGGESSRARDALMEQLRQELEELGGEQAQARLGLQRELEGQISALSGEEARKRSLLQEGLQQQIERMGGAQDEARREAMKSLSGQISGLNADLTLLKQTEINDLQGKWNSQQEEINAQNEQYRQLQNEWNRQQGEINAQNAKYQELDSEWKRQQGEINDQNAKYQQLDAGWKKQQHAINRQNTQFRELQTTINNEQTGINALNIKFQKESEERHLEQGVVNARLESQQESLDDLLAQVILRTPQIYSFRFVDGVKSVEIGRWGTISLEDGNAVFNKTPGWRGSAALQANIKATKNYGASASWPAPRGPQKFTLNVGTFDYVESGLVIIIVHDVE